MMRIVYSLNLVYDSQVGKQQKRPYACQNILYGSMMEENISTNKHLYRSRRLTKLLIPK